MLPSLCGRLVTRLLALLPSSTVPSTGNSGIRFSSAVPRVPARRSRLSSCGPRHRHRSLRSSNARSACESACRSEEHTSELQSRQYLVCRLLLEKKTKNKKTQPQTKDSKTDAPHCHAERTL